jgi:hypothetical protein
VAQGDQIMAFTLSEIHEREIAEDYPLVVTALEDRLGEDANDRETVIRLGFNLWYAIAENDRMGKRLPTEQYARRFMELFSRYCAELKDNPDFCWSFGQGMQMFWYWFPGATEERGKSLIIHACTLDPFYRRFAELTNEELAGRFRGRGILQVYYNYA